MSTFTAIDLSRLPAPAVVETLDYENILQDMKTDLQNRADGFTTLQLESEPVVKLLEVCAYRELLLRQRINDASHAVMLAHAREEDLDNLAALFAVERQLLDAGDEDASPPIPPTYESDERLRRRVQLSLEGHSTAGPVGSYVFHALSADSHVKDVDVASPTPGHVLVTVLSSEGNGTPSNALLDAVAAKLNHEDIRPLTDYVTVQAASVQEYNVNAVLTMYGGPDTELVRQAAQQAVETYVTEHLLLGHDITLSGLYAALHQPGVQNVQLNSPAADIVCQAHEAAACSTIQIITGGTDE